MGTNMPIRSLRRGFLMVGQKSHRIENGWTFPIEILVDNIVIPKPLIEWMKEESKKV